MTSSDYNPNDLEFLLSRNVDGELTPEEQRHLRELLANSSELRSQDAELQSVAGLVSRWGEAPPDVDWAIHAKLVQANLTEPAGAADQRLDALLRGWAVEQPAVNEDALLAGVMGQIRVRRRTRALYPLLRIAGPLAAAAVLALSVSTIFWTAPAITPTVVVELGHSSLVSVSQSESTAVVSFARDSGKVQTSVETSSIAFLTLGSSPAVSNEAAPL